MNPVIQQKIDEKAEAEERYKDCADLVGIMAEIEINKELLKQ